MRRAIAAAALVIAGTVSFAQDRTLRIDYEFSGTAKDADISVAEIRSLDGWAGRRVNTDRVLLRGNGQISMRDTTGKLLYINSFSTLFQEWQNSEEATRVRKSFENVFLLPMPQSEAWVHIELYDSHGRTQTKLTHLVDPDDILIRPVPIPDIPYKYIHYSGSPEEKIDIAIIAEGYTARETDLFYEDAAKAAESIWSHEPYSSMRDRFNIVAVAVPSEESGVSVPRQGLWKSTALSSHFDTFYSDRYLTTLHLGDLHDALAGVPYEHIIILANTSTYGGGGIFNSYVLSAAHHELTPPVVVHEFGHSFAGLADEYYYDDQYEEFYFPDVEPWEPNITTLAYFDSKWKDLVGKDGVGIFEGGGYQSKGVFRPSDDCRMKTNGYPSYCPVCERAVRKIIDFYTVQE